MTKVVSIAIQKGGTGKTTTTLSLSAGLAKTNHPVLIIDLDPQANSSKVLLPDYLQSVTKEKAVYQTILERKPLPVRQTQLPHLDIVPSHILLSDTDMALATAIDHREARLKTQLDKIKERYEYILIDCPPSLSWLTINAFTASDEVVLVVEPGYFELDSIIQVLKTVHTVKQDFNPNLVLKGILFNKSAPTSISGVSLKLLNERYAEYVLKTVIPSNVALKNASAQKQDIFSYDPKSPAADAYGRLIKELFP